MREAAGRGGRRYYNGVRAAVTSTANAARRACRVRAGIAACLVVLPLLAAAQPAPGAAAPASAPRGRRDPAASSPAAADTGPSSLLARGTMDLRWATPPDVALAAPPAFDAATAYVATRDRAVMALALDTGAVRWRAATTAAFTPAVGGGRVFVVADGGVQAFEASSGRAAWQKTLPGTLAAPPTYDTGWLLLSFAGGDFAALRAEDGTLMWRTPLGAVAHVPPAPALDNLYLGLEDGRTLALSLATGAVVWTQPLEGRASGLTALDDQLVVGTSAGFVASLDLRTGVVRWRFRTGAAVVAAPAADDARIYVVAYDHLLRALDRRRGHLRWKRALPHRPADGPLVTGGTVLVPLFASELQGYAATSGQPSLTVATGGEVAGATRFLTGGRPMGTRLTTISTEGQLLAFGPRIEPAPAPLDALPGVPVPEPPAPTSQPPPGGSPR